MSRVAFYVGLFVFLVGLVVWIARPNKSRSRNSIKALGMEFSLSTPAFAVMALGIVLMALSPQFPAYFSSASSKTVVCTGEHEGNCPGAHQAYYDCDYFGSDQDIADKICHRKATAVRLKTVSGNRCGYSLIEVTCD
jgi:hypothetical protein